MHKCVLLAVWCVACPHRDRKGNQMWPRQHGVQQPTVNSSFPNSPVETPVIPTTRRQAICGIEKQHLQRQPELCVCASLRVSVRREAKYTRLSFAKLLFLGREFSTTVSENTLHVWGTRMKPSAVKTVWKNDVFFTELKSTQWHHYILWDNFIIGAWYCHS